MSQYLIYMLMAYTLTWTSSNRAAIAWAGTDGKTSWIYVNGNPIPADGPTVYSGANKSVTLTLSDPAAIEVHETDASEPAPPINFDLRRLPTFWFNEDGAVYYKIYCTPAGGVEAVLMRYNADPTTDHYEIRSPSDLRVDNNGQWNLFRVEAVNSQGVESVRAAWAKLIEGLPPPPKTMTPSGAAGVFTLTIGT